MPAAAHLASVPPHAELDVVGMRADRERDLGARSVVRRSASVTDRAVEARRGRPGRRRRSRASGSRTTRTAEAERAGGGGVAPERAGPVGEREAASAGHREHRGAVVAVARHDGHDRRAPSAAKRTSAPGRARGQVGVGDDRPAPGRASRATRRRRRSTAASSPRPGRRRRRARGRRPRRAPRRSDETTTTAAARRRRRTRSAIASRELGALVVVERVGEPRLARPERPDRDHDARVRASGPGTGSMGLRMLPARGAGLRWRRGAPVPTAALRRAVDDRGVAAHPGRAGR